MWINLLNKRGTMVLDNLAKACYLGLGLLMAGPAGADWHGKLSFLSDYVYRGYSKSRGNQVVQGQLDYQAEAGWFLGAALSQASFDDHDYPNYATVEAKPFVGMQWPLSTDWQAEASAYGYLYDGDVFGKPSDFGEIAAALHYQDSLSGKIAVAPSAYQRQATVDYELSYRRDVYQNIQLSAGLGFYQAKNLVGKDYLYWNLGGSWFLNRHLVIDLRYVDVQLNGNYADGWRYGAFQPRLLSNHLLLSVSVGF
ncbi:MAG: TorF family putative porin [Methylovulum sp.]|nr:TorF family putative porin [Methylovulum sp.]